MLLIFFFLILASLYIVRSEYTVSLDLGHSFKYCWHLSCSVKPAYDCSVSFDTSSLFSASVMNDGPYLFLFIYDIRELLTIMLIICGWLSYLKRSRMSFLTDSREMRNILPIVSKLRTANFGGDFTADP